MTRRQDLPRLMVRLALAGGLAAIFSTPAASQDRGQAVPFVGCAADGALGPREPPRKHAGAPPVGSQAAGRLAYYATDDLGVLAPRGWHCLGLYGSSGLTLLVTPQSHPASELLGPRFKLSGPAVALSYSYGGTSGRFAVAQVAARLFPAASPFVQKVAAEGVAGAAPRPPATNPRAVLRRVDSTAVEFVTPANRDGIGTSGLLAAETEPIAGAAILLTGDAPDLVKLDVRLARDMRPLERTIATAVENDYRAGLAP